MSYPNLNIAYSTVLYKLERLNNGEYILLDRNYKPLGSMARERVDYESYPSSKLKLIIGKVEVRKLSIDKSDDVNNIYLFNDPSAPWRSEENLKRYMDKLNYLWSLKLKCP